MNFHDGISGSDWAEIALQDSSFKYKYRHTLSLFFFVKFLYNHLDKDLINGSH